MTKQGPVQGVLNSGPALVASAVVGVVIPLVGFLASRNVRDWISTNGTPTFWIGLAVIGALLIALDLQRRGSPPDQRDVELMGKLRHAFGGDSRLITWLRECFAPNRFSRDTWHELAATLDAWQTDPSRRFSDRKVQKKYEEMLAQLHTFMHRVDDDVFAAPGSQGSVPEPEILGLPADWRGDDDFLRRRFDTAVEEIGESRKSYLEALTDLLTTAHKRGL